MSSDCRQMTVLLFTAIIFTFVVNLQGQDAPVTESSPMSHSGTFMRSIWKTYDDESLVPGLKAAPVQFSLIHEDPSMLRIDFNSSTLKDPSMSRNFTPEAFGMMFLGEKDRYVAFEVEKSDKSEVSIYDGFHKKLMPMQELKVSYKLLVSDNDYWNGTIQIPLDYLPRAMSKMAAYCNFTEHPGDKKKVLSLQGKKTDMAETVPDLQKPEYFQDVKLKDQMANLDFSNWSKLWQDVLESQDSSSSSATNETDSTSDHQAHTGNNNNTATVTTPLFTLVSVSALMLTLHP